MICLTGSSYTMKADIYVPTKTQDQNTGAVMKTWVNSKTISCFAKGIVRDTISDNSSAVDIKNYLTAVSNIVKIRSLSPINSEYRVVAIRNSQGVIWSEGDTISSQGGISGATIFEPRGSTPIMDFDGRVIEYETVLQRQEIQTLESL
jgi:hypothetical protein